MRRELRGRRVPVSPAVPQAAGSVPDRWMAVGSPRWWVSPTERSRSGQLVATALNLTRQTTAVEKLMESLSGLAGYARITDVTQGDAERYQWPDDMPDRCPPETATQADGDYYRFVKHDPPVKDDFVRPRDQPHWKRNPGPDLCRGCALSLVRDRQDVLTMRDFVPAMRKRLVALGTLDFNAGMVENSPTDSPVIRSHFDWWVPIDVAPEVLFSVVAV